MKIRFSRLSVLALASALSLTALTGCGSDGGNASALAKAAAGADSIVSSMSDANVEVNAAGTGLDATFRMSDSLIDPAYLGQDLFDVYAAQQLKDYPSAAVNAVSKAVQASKGDITVELLWPGGRNARFTLTPRRFVDLQRAKNSQLNMPAAKTQLTDLARHIIPAPEASKGCDSIETSINKSFLEYTFVWPSASAYANDGQGMLTGRYFNALKRMYTSLGAPGPDIVRMLQGMGVDGIRIVYAAKDSDKTLQQAFPWREIQKPVEEPQAK